MSHPQAIAQSEEFLSALEVTVRAEYNTAGAAKRIAEERLEGIAAIASARAGELYGLEVLAERIQTYPDNYTRFGVLVAQPGPARPSRTRRRSSSASATSRARSSAASARSPSDT